ncbi:unnamed protein product [Rhizophagus irregularis]|nr:unnamed protein product [Rhizophagus irregularis]
MIGNLAIREIARSCYNLKFLGLEACKGISRNVLEKLDQNIKIEWPDSDSDNESNLSDSECKNNIWKDEVLREIRKRLIVDCTFIRAKVTVKALIDPKSFHGSISKALAKKMDLYISRLDGSRYPAVRDLGIGATNAGKKVMRRGWVDREEVSVALPNIFDEIVPPSYLGIDTANFVVVDKPEYNLVLGSV